MTSADIIARIKKQPVGFACLLISLLCGGWLYYRGGDLDQQQAEYEAKSAEAANFSSNITLAKNLPEQVSEMQALTKELESRLIREGQLAVNLQYFYKLEAENEVKLLDVKQNTRPKSGKPTYSGIPFSVNVQGPYKNVMAFLQRLEKGRHFCRIINAGFSKSAGGGDTSTPTGITLVLSLELLGQP
jgi:Tfp pilus assembly protein PilO